MSADGNWKITMNTPMGARTMDVSITTNGDSFTGKVDGDTLTWSTDITTPMPMKLDFSATVAGDKMTGNVKLGMFGNAALTGERA